jgi:hypothetical protein
MLYLIAGNGGPNFGDELIVAHWLRFYREAGYDGPITVDGRGAGPSERLLTGFGDVAFVSRIPRHGQGLDRGYADFARLGRGFARANEDGFAKVSMVHVCGGGYASGVWRNATRLLATASELKRLLGVPLVGTGLGLGPFVDMNAADAAAFRSIVDDFDLLECRDALSFDAMQTLVGARPELIAGLDDAFLEPVVAQNRASRWLHLSGWQRTALFGGAGTQAIRDLFAAFDKVVFWTCSRVDAELFAELSAEFPEIQRYGTHRLLNQSIPVAPQDAMLTCRFHPHLIAARAGMTGRYAARSAFYRAKHDLVLGLGSPFRPVDHGALGAFAEPDGRMTAADADRVAAKRRVAGQVLARLPNRTSGVQASSSGQAPGERAPLDRF